MDLSQLGLRFIARREGLALVSYTDGRYFSIGFGHNDPKLKPGDTITVKEAFALLKEDVKPRAAEVTRMLKVPVNQHQFDALVSFYYQSGRKFVPDIISTLINVGDINHAAQLFPNCDTNSAGKHIPGLRRRRLLEQKIFLSGEYGELSPIPMWRGDPAKVKAEQYHVKDGDFT